jgi:hypothetical protein
MSAAAEKGGKYGSPGGGTGSVSYAAMRGDVLEAWGNGGKVLEAVVCDAAFCNVQGVTATKTDMYVAVSTTRPDGSSSDSEVWRYPLSGGRAESIYRAADTRLGNVAATANGDIYLLQTVWNGGTSTIRRLRNGSATDVVSGSVGSLSAARNGKAVAYTRLNSSDPNKFISELWVLDSATGETRLVAADGSVSPNISLSADGSFAHHYNMNSNPVGQTTLRNLVDGTVTTTQVGSTGCLDGNNKLITWEYTAAGVTVTRSSSTQTLPPFSSSETACRPDGALVGLLEPKVAPAAAVNVASEGDNGSMEHVCGVGVSSGDLAVIRADGTTTRLGHDYHRIFQL